MKSGSDMAQQWVSPVRPWWQLPDARAGDLLSAGAKQLTEDFAHDQLLKSVEHLWNANPLHDVIPLDWAGIAYPDRCGAGAMEWNGRSGLIGTSLGADDTGLEHRQTLGSALAAWVYSTPGFRLVDNPQARYHHDKLSTLARWREF